MSTKLNTVVIAALFASGAAVAPASAQMRTRPVIAPTGPVKPVRSSESEAPSASASAVPTAALQKKVKAAYYCNIEIATRSIGKEETPKQEQFTLSALDDGSLVYGGKDPASTNARYQLIDDGEWRVIEFVGWIKGREPPKGMLLPKMSSGSWTISPRIHRNTGEYSAQSLGQAFGISSSSIATGSCTGGV